MSQECDSDSDDWGDDDVSSPEVSVKCSQTHGLVTNEAELLIFVVPKFAAEVTKLLDLQMFSMLHRKLADAFKPCFEPI